MFDRFAVGMANWNVPGTGANATNLSNPTDIANLIMNILVWLVAALAVAFIVIGGIKYVTSGGDEKKVASAKNTILYAVIGLVVALLANVLIRLILNAIGVTNHGF